MALEITGKLNKVLPEVTGTGKNGQWVKQEFIIQTEEQFPKMVCFSVWGDKVASIKNISEGSQVKVSFNAESREYSGRWYTDLRAWKIESNVQATTEQVPDYVNEEFNITNLQEPVNDLPF
jgi:hypothetical protein